MNIQKPTFTEADIYVIERTDQKILLSAIEYLKTSNEVMWLDNDTDEVISHSELKRRSLRIQPRPQYSVPLREMGEMFWRMMWVRQDLRVSLRNEGFCEENSFALRYAGTMYSAALIASYICFAFVHERIHDGFFGYGVEDGSYLKMLLHLEDLIKYYEYSKTQGR